MSLVKNLFLRMMLIPGATAPFSTLLRGRATIFMLHRFREPNSRVAGHDPEMIRQGLAYLRRKKYLLVSLEEVFRRIAEGAPLERVVAFTIDDGYRDQARVGAKLFAEFNCPVTTFLTTGFLDHRIFFWSDKIDYIFSHTSRLQISVGLAGNELSYRWNEEAGRRVAQTDFTERCKDVPETDRLAAVGMLAKALAVDLPDEAPPEYSPMSWEEARECEKLGMTFGPHTVTHPFLSQIKDDQSATEIATSWNRLRSEVKSPVPVFCYPYGRLVDFGPREVTHLQSLGFSGAVAGAPGYSSREAFHRSPSAPFEVRRWGYPDTLAYLVQLVSGVERFKQILRRETD